MEVKWYTSVFPRLFSDQIFGVPVLCQTLCKAVKILPRELRHGFSLLGEQGQLCHLRMSERHRAMCIPLGNTAVARDEAWTWFWNMSRHFQTELKDIPSGEEGTRQRHRAVVTVHGVPGLGGHGRGQRGVCRRVGGLKEFCSAGTESHWWWFEAWN